MRKALSSPESMSPALISLPVFGAGSACCASAAGTANAAIMTIAKAKRLPNRSFVISIISVLCLLKQCALPHGCGQGAFIEIIELAADRYAVGKPRYLDTGVLQEVGDVVRGGLAIDGCVQCQDDFAHARIMRARNQRVDSQVLRADAVER